MIQSFENSAFLIFESFPSSFFQVFRFEISIMCWFRREINSKWESKRVLQQKNYFLFHSFSISFSSKKNKKGILSLKIQNWNQTNFYSFICFRWGLFFRGYFVDRFSNIAHWKGKHSAGMGLSSFNYSSRMSGKKFKSPILCFFFIWSWGSSVVDSLIFLAPNKIVKRLKSLMKLLNQLNSKWTGEFERIFGDKKFW